MTSHPSPRPVTALRARMIEDMMVRGFTEETRNDYRRAWRSARSHCPRPQSRPARRCPRRGPHLPVLAATGVDFTIPDAARAIGVARGRPPLVPCRTLAHRHPRRILSPRPRHHRVTPLAEPALSPIGLLPRLRGRSPRNLAGAAGGGHRPLGTDHRPPPHLARSHSFQQGAARRAAKGARSFAGERRPPWRCQGCRRRR
jgi:hypothetical protein